MKMDNSELKQPTHQKTGSSLTQGEVLLSTFATLKIPKTHKTYKNSIENAFK